MTGRFRIDPAQLSDVIGQLERFEHHLHTAMTDAQTHVDRLHTTWSGPAAQAHRRAYREWYDGIATMHTALVSMRQIAATAHTNYTGAVDTNTAMWAQLR